MFQFDRIKQCSTKGAERGFEITSNASSRELDTALIDISFAIDTMEYACLKAHILNELISIGIILWEN